MKRFLVAAALSAAAFSSSADDAAVKAAIESLVPAAKIDSISESQVPNFYQVVLQGQVVYISADGKYLFQGSVFDIPNKTDLTEAAKAGLRKGALAAVEKAGGSVELPAEKPSEHEKKLARRDANKAAAKAAK